MPKRLYRAPGGKIGGVAKGLAEYFNVDPVLVRLLFIVALLTGAGLVAYLVFWVVVPRAETWPPPGYEEPTAAEAQRREGLSGVASGLTIVALAALLGAGLDGVGGFLLPAALLGFGVYLLNQRAPKEGQPPAPSTASGEAMSSGAERTAKESPGLVTPTVLSGLALCLGLALALRAAGVVDVSAAGLASVGVLAVGAGLLASLRYGPAPGLVPAGLVLTAVMLGAPKVTAWTEGSEKWGQKPGATLDSLDPSGGGSRDAVGWAQLALESWNAGTTEAPFGKLNIKPKALEGLAPRYSLGAGKIVLDLTEIDFGTESRSVGLQAGMAKVLVYLPSELSVDITAEVGAGKLEVLGERAVGEENLSIRHTETTEGAGQLNLDIDVGLGKVKVQRGN